MDTILKQQWCIERIIWERQASRWKIYPG